VGARLARTGRLLLLVGFLGQIPLGLTVAFGYRSPLWAWHRRGMARQLWGLEEVPELAAPVVDQLAAMLGATMACWGLAMAWVVAGPMARGDPRARWCVASSTLLWFVVDTGLSANHGVWVNVAFNTAALFMIGIPLAMAWRRPNQTVP
jgi:hypothetical protein